MTSGRCPWCRIGFGLLIGLLAAASASAQERKSDVARPGPGRHALVLETAGHVWDYQVQVPKSYRPDQPTPVVLILHGAGGSGQVYLDQAGWAAKSQQAGFLAVAPDALPAQPEGKPNFWLNPRVWNTGQLPGGSLRGQIDDLAFFRALLDDVARRWTVDPRRVYVTGHSNGAGMTFRLGAELSELSAALAPVASHCWLTDPRPARPRPTLFIIGKLDPLVPWNGGERTLPWGKRTMPPVEQTLDRWSKALGCPSIFTERELKPGLTKRAYSPGRDGATLTALVIAGQGHGWPGGKGVLPERMIGPNVDTLDATDTIWEFFESVKAP